MVITAGSWWEAEEMAEFQQAGVLVSVVYHFIRIYIELNVENNLTNVAFLWGVSEYIKILQNIKQSKFCDK